MAVSILGAATGLSACVSLDTATPERIEAAAQHGDKQINPNKNFSKTGLEALDARLKQTVTDSQVPGLAYSLVQGDRVIAQGYHGVQSWNTNRPIQEDTIYRIYSMTKPITGVAMMQLWEDGKFDLDDPVTKFIPEFEGLEVLVKNEDGSWSTEPMRRSPTMRELMSHTAGFAYGLFGNDPANKAFRDQKIIRSADMQSLIDATAKVPLLYQPGEKWSYSAAVDLQGAIVERISGQRFGSYLDEHIFTPLGMDDTAFYVEDSKYDRFSDVFGFDPRSKKLAQVPFPTVQYKKNTVAFESGGGGLTSTLGDYKAFTQMMLDEGTYNGNRILKPATVRLMRENHAGDVEIDTAGSLSRVLTDGLGFGLDFGVYLEPEKANLPFGKNTYYWGGAAGTWFWIDPTNDLYFIGMIQRFGYEGEQGLEFRGGSAALVYDAMK